MSSATLPALSSPLILPRKNSERWLILGDGDFTFSLDVARYLTSCHYVSGSTKEEAKEKNRRSNTSIHLFCTSLDSRDDLKSKYKDIDSILKRLNEFQNRPLAFENVCSYDNYQKQNKKKRSYPSNEKGDCARLTITIEHGVDALFITDRIKLFHPTRVIFNHPHLGTEDAILHKQFLCHLFHSFLESFSNHVSPIPSNYKTRRLKVHIALAKRQRERWKCVEAAKRFDFELVNVTKFTSPLDRLQSRIDDPHRSAIHATYKTRRHQSGRSFGSRTSGSELCTFILNKGLDNSKTATAKNNPEFLLPWIILNQEDLKHTQLPYKCNICEKSFREKRSLKNHMKSLHSNITSALEKERNTRLICKLCKEERVFSSEDALRAHNIAKHTGTCIEIKPDWMLKAKVPDSFEISPLTFQCTLCDASFATNIERDTHIQKKIPMGDAVKKRKCKDFSCKFCQKQFKDKRAMLQHTNFCANART